jgi:non-ribosomal peptide synthetase component E (peptide arylation enzyme)
MMDGYVRAGYWTEETTLDLLNRQADIRPDAIAIVDSANRLTWRQARDAVEIFAHRLDSLDLERDTPVVVQLPNSVEDALLRLALLRVGLLGSYLPVVWRRGELETVIEVLRPGALIVPRRFRDVDTLAVARDLRSQFVGLRIVVVGSADDADDCLQISLDDELVSGAPAGDIAEEKQFRPFEVTKLVVTSGSTGKPKIVERPEQQELLWGKGLADRLGLTADDNIGGFVPLSGGPGYHAWAGWLVTGAKLVLSEGFAPEVLLPLIEQESVTVVMTAPTILARLADWPDVETFDTGPLRAIRTGSANLPLSVALTAERRFDCMVVKAGGSMETCSFGQVSIDDPPEIRHGETIGRVMPGGEARIVDQNGDPLPAGSSGELWIRGAATSSGYCRDPKTTKEIWGTLGPEGWFRTGDVATIDDDGYVTLIGRIKEMINRGGMNIFPVELENILAEHPNILEAALVGLPDPTLGEIACLCVIPTQAADVTLDEIAEFLRNKELAEYKIPARVMTFSDFPRGQTMRVNRRALAEQVGQRLGMENLSDRPDH